MKKSLTKLCIVLAVNSLLNTHVLSQTPGSLDTSFDTDGKVILALPAGVQSTKANAVVIQPDGKIVVAGESNDNDIDYIVARFLPDGTPDNTFGTGGVVITEINTSSGATSVALEPGTGKIVIAGFAVVNNGRQISVFRYNSNGTPDTGFGTNGSIVESIGVHSESHSVIVKPDGKILVGGYSNSSPVFLVMSYNNDGTPDLSFNGTGMGVITFSSTEFPSSSSMVLQPDGKIVMGGSVRNSNKRDLVVTRFNADGTIDTGFGFNNGIFQTVSTTTSEEIYAIGLQPDGKIVAAGVRGGNTAPQNIILARYNANGSQDTGFGTAGVVIDGFTVNNMSRVKALVLQADGTIIVGGQSYTGTVNAPTNADFALVRFSTTGTVDTSFGNNGKVITPVDASGGVDLIYAMKLQQDGKLIAAGIAAGKIAVARYVTGVSTAGLDEISNVIHGVSLFPNPVTNQFTVSYSLAQEAEVAIHICDVSGRYIAPLAIPSSETAGEHERVIQLPSELVSGCYYVVVSAGNHQQTTRIVVSK